MTLLIIHPNLTERGGAERKILLLARYLKKDGHHVKILCFRYQKETCFGELICDDDILFCDIKKIWFIAHFVTLILLHRKFTRLVISNYPAHLFGIWIKVFMPKKKMIWICNEVNSLLHARISSKHKVIMWFERRFIYKFDLIIANSENTKTKIKTYFDSDAVVVYPGLNLRNNGPIKRVNRDEYFLCLSRLTRGKNIEFLEEVLKVSPYKVIVAGDGELAPFIEHLATKYGNLEVAGLVSDPEKFDLYRNALAMLFLPIDEPFGVTNIEAINEGCPVIAFNRGGPKEIITNGKNGYLCDNDEEYLAHVARFSRLKVEPKFFGEMMHERFSLEKMLRGLRDVIFTGDNCRKDNGL